VADEAVQRPWADFWVELDGDGDGRISLPEFQAFLGKHVALAAVVLADSPPVAAVAAQAEAAAVAGERDAAVARTAGLEVELAAARAAGEAAATGQEAAVARFEKLKGRTKAVMADLQAAQKQVAGLQAEARESAVSAHSYLQEIESMQRDAVISIQDVIQVKEERWAVQEAATAVVLRCIGDAKAEAASEASETARRGQHHAEVELIRLESESSAALLSEVQRLTDDLQLAKSRAAEEEATHEVFARKIAELQQANDALVNQQSDSVQSLEAADAKHAILQKELLALTTAMEQQCAVVEQQSGQMAKLNAELERLPPLRRSWQYCGMNWKCSGHANARPVGRRRHFKPSWNRASQREMRWPPPQRGLPSVCGML